MNYGPSVEQFAPIVYKPNAILLVRGAQLKGKPTNRREWRQGSSIATQACHRHERVTWTNTYKG